MVAQDYLNGKYPNAKLSVYSAAADDMLALQSGKLDYVMTSRSTALYMMKRDANLKIAQDGERDEACYIAVSKHRADRKKKVDAVLARFWEDGALGELNERWGGGRPGLLPRGGDSRGGREERCIESRAFPGCTADLFRTGR